jgi:hypothetical protein
MKLPSKTQGEGIATILVVVAVIAIVFIVGGKLFKGLNGLFEAFGLKDTKEEIEDRQNVEQQAATGTDVFKAFNPQYWKQQSGALLFTQSLTDSLVKMLWDSVGTIYDTPSLGMTAIKRCETKSQVSWLSYNFTKKHGMDLLSWLKSKYDTKEQVDTLSTMFNHVKSLPDFRR